MPKSHKTANPAELQDQSTRNYGMPFMMQLRSQICMISTC